MVKQAACISAIVGVIIIIVSVFTALFMTPGYDICTQYLSMLGINGLGAVIFSSGLIIAGILVAPLFIHLKKHLGNTAMVRNGSILGVAASLSLIGASIFPAAEPWVEIHRAFAFGFFSMIALAIFLFGIRILSKSSGMSRALAVYGFVVIAIDAFMLTGIYAPIVQKIAALAIMLWVLFFAIYLIRRKR